MKAEEFFKISCSAKQGCNHAKKSEWGQCLKDGEICRFLTIKGYEVDEGS